MKIAIASFVLVGSVVLATPILHYTTMDTISFTVEHRERVISRTSEGKSSARYMIWAQVDNGNTEVFENTDSLLSLKYNSADLYGQMREGRICEATVNGFRIPFLSMNRNIITAHCEDITF